MWSCRDIDKALQEDWSALKLDLHHGLTAHDGSIFGLDVCLYDVHSANATIMLATCSDDRKVKIWAVPFQAARASVVTTDGRPMPINSSHDDVPYNIATMWGHASRIWHVSFFAGHESAGTALRLMSVGEDATARTWTFRINLPKSDSILESSRSYALHAGKNIWSFSQAHSPTSARAVVTGGADGAIKYLELPQSPNPDPEATKVTRVAILTPSTRYLFRSYAFIRSNTIIAITADGIVVVGVLTMPQLHANEALCQDDVSWEHVATYDSLKSYSVLAAIPTAGIALFGDSIGNVYCYHDYSRVVTPIYKVSGKIAKLFGSVVTQPRAAFTPAIKQSAASVLNDESVLHFIIGIALVGTDFMQILHFRDLKDQTPTLTGSRQIRLGDQRLMPTSMLHILLPSGAELLAIGHREGDILQVNFSDSETASHQLLANVHSGSITSMHWFWDYSSSDTKGYLLSAARDSSYCIQQCTLANAVTFSVVHRAVLPFGPHIEGIHIRETDQHLILWGFKSTNFILFDATVQMELMSVDCGGAHRVWAFNIGNLDASRRQAQKVATFIWSKASQMQLVSQSRSVHQVLKTGGHGREIKGSAATSLQDLNGAISLLATGAEDTDIRLFEVLNPSGDEISMECITTLYGHNTGLQQLRFSPDGKRLFSCGGCEELLVWRIHRIPFIKVGVRRESQMPLISETSDLRIMSFEIRQLAGTASETDEEPEASRYVVALALSNSVIRVILSTDAIGARSSC